jgi:hypothetical protein
MSGNSIVSLCILGLAACGCGGASQDAGNAHSSTAATHAKTKPRCPPGVDDQPSDARQRMSALEAPLKKCFALGTAGAYGVSTLQLEIVVAESGKVKSATVHAQDAQPAAAECAEREAKKAKFAKFCGDDADIHWTYTLQ